MAIVYVGANTPNSRAGTTATQAVNFAFNNGNGETVPIAGDLVIVTVVVASAGRTPALAITTPTGYTALTQLNVNGTTYDTSICVSYKFMGTTPDTSVTIPGTGNNADAQSYTIQCLRGVDQTTPFDVAHTTATGTGTSLCNPASITPVTSGAWVTTHNGGAAAVTTTQYTTSGLSNVRQTGGADTNSSRALCSADEWTSGAFDPAAFTAGSNNAADSWGSYTIAWRPAALFDTLTENFSAALDTTNKWTVTLDTTSTQDVTGGTLNLTCTGTDQFAYASTKNTFTLKESGVYVKLTQGATNAGANGADAQFSLEKSDGSALRMWQNSNNILTFTYKIGAAASVSAGTSITYVPATHAWWRIREASGTIYFDSAPATASNPPVSGDWVNHATLALSTFTPGAYGLTLELGSTTWTATSNGTVKWDGVNTAANSGTTNTNSTADPATFSMTGVAAKNAIGSSAAPVSYATNGADATSAVAAAIASLSDTFAGPTLDAKWIAFTGDAGSSVSIVTHAAQFDHNGDIVLSGNPIPMTGIKSADHIITNSGVNVRFVPATTSGSDNGWTSQVVMLLDETNEDGIAFLIEGPEGAKKLKFIIYNGFTTNWQAPVPAVEIDYSPTNHAWLRLEHNSAGGTFLWKTAPDSSGSPGTFTQRASQTVSALEGDPNFWDTAAFLASAKLFIAEWHWDNQFADSMWVTHARVLAVNASATGSGTNTDSVGSPATYSHTGAVASSGIGSAAAPGAYVLAGAAATSTSQRVSVALPATYSFTGSTTTDVQALNIPSVALPATYSYTTSANTAGVVLRNYSSVALPATYSLSGVATSDLASYSSIASPTVYTLTGSLVIATRGPISAAMPATYATTGFSADAVIVRNPTSVALPAAYSLSAGTGTRAILALTSQATPASYVTTGTQTTDVMSAVPTPTDNAVDTSRIHLPPAITDEQFTQWLHDPMAKRVILFETRCLDEYGNLELLYFASRGYVSHPYDTASNRYYLPLIRGGLDFEHRINLDLSGDRSYGDIELDNTEGDLDHLFTRMFQYQPAEAFVGDVTWPRRDFRRIYIGTVQDISSSARDALNVKLRDRLHQLDMAITDAKIGGTTSESDKLYPMALGECHNISPVLVNASKLRFQFNILAGTNAFEVRDGGVPIKRSMINQGVEAIFELLANPAGRITASVHGDYVMPRPWDPHFDWGGYQNNVTDLIIRLMLMWGTNYDRRFKADDIDWENFKEFREANMQPVGMYITEPMTVLEACQQLAASVGARLTADLDGKVKLIKVQLPAPGNVIYVTESDMVANSLEVAVRIPRKASVKIGYCRNWTIQQDVLAGVPEEHRKMYESEWLVARATDPYTRLAYGLESEPEQENTLLLRGYDATIEADRRLRLRREQRHVFRFEGFADLMFTEVGSPMHITHRRFGLENGKVGQVLSVSVNWLTCRVIIEVLI